MYEHSYDMYLTLYGILQTSCLRCVHEPVHVHVQTKLERGEERRSGERNVSIPSAIRVAYAYAHAHAHAEA